MVRFIVGLAFAALGCGGSPNTSGNPECNAEFAPAGCENGLICCGDGLCRDRCEGPDTTLPDVADTTDIIDTVDTAETVDTADTVDTTETVDTVDTTEPPDTTDTTDTTDTAEPPDTTDTTDTAAPPDTADTSDTQDTTDTTDTGPVDNTIVLVDPGIHTLGGVVSGGGILLLDSRLDGVSRVCNNNLCVLGGIAP